MESFLGDDWPVGHGGEAEEPFPVDEEVRPTLEYADEMDDILIRYVWDMPAAGNARCRPVSDLFTQVEAAATKETKVSTRAKGQSSRVHIQA